jgi:hypothetical protein
MVIGRDGARYQERLCRRWSATIYWTGISQLQRRVDRVGERWVARQLQWKVSHELRVSYGHELVVRQSPAGKVVNTEAEEPTLFGAVTEQRILNTITEEDIASALVRNLMVV